MLLISKVQIKYSTSFNKKAAFPARYYHKALIFLLHVPLLGIKYHHPASHPFLVESYSWLLPGHMLLVIDSIPSSSHYCLHLFHLPISWILVPPTQKAMSKITISKDRAGIIAVRKMRNHWSMKMYTSKSTDSPSGKLFTSVGSNLHLSSFLFIYLHSNSHLLCFLFSQFDAFLGSHTFSTFSSTSSSSSS